MSTNISKLHREDLLCKIRQIRTYIASAPQDQNTGNLLQYLDELVKEVKGKKYGLVFEQHREAIDETLQTHVPVLTEQPDLFIDNGGQMNFLIEGDNLASLQLLEKTHNGKIDVIYIDPPYNTGNKDFVYDDNYVDSNDTFRHSKWLSFMEKRLRIAKELLSKKGVIFISIDDNEQAQLKLLCDGVFDEMNYIATMIWKSKSGGANDSSAIASDHEYIICYAKKSSWLKINNDIDAVVTTQYNKEDEFGRYALDRLDKQSLGYQSSLDFPIVGTDGNVYTVEHKDPQNKKARWRWSKDTVEERYDELVFIYPYVYTKNYEKKDGQKPRTILFEERFGRTRTGSTDLKKIIGNQSIFTYPKPNSLLKYIFQISSDSKHPSTILDFFAGSGTTGHAVMKLNAEDGGKRRFILCTNNENNICRDVTYERLKTVITGKRKDGSEYAEKYDASLKYYKVEFVPITDKVYYDYADELLLHVRELVELENGINFTGNSEIAIVLTDDEMAQFVQTSQCGVSTEQRTDGARPVSNKMPHTLYRGHNVLLTAEQEAFIAAHGIRVHVIPDYYYNELTK